uniref:Transmembrane protein n=1 Tax=Opuntia streptacantha TaxID=393608 RepID=A0A7C8YLS6_OPUST
MRHRWLNNTSRCCLKFEKMEYTTCCIVLLTWCRFFRFVLSRDPLQSKDCVYFKNSVILTKFCGQMCRIAKPRQTIQIIILLVFPPIEQPSYKLQSIALDLDAFHGLQFMSCCAVGLLSTSVIVEHHLHYSSFWWVLVFWFLGIQAVQLLMGYCGAGLECW